MTMQRFPILHHTLFLLFLATGSVALAQDDDTGTEASDPADDRALFRPYKDNYVTIGRMQNHDGSEPFSGERMDLQFALGLQFGLFHADSDFGAFAPLRFGYSQKSWWNIGERSEPFAEHNYNPEVFWEFDQPPRPLFGTPPFIDRIGMEHESNGKDGTSSRAWDRVYVEKHLSLTERLELNVKLWGVLSRDTYNPDITDYLGYGELGWEARVGERTRIRLVTQPGSNGHISYGLDIRFRVSSLVNSELFLSWHDGYGESLGSYNVKTRSLRFGLYFPLESLTPWTR